MKTKLGFLILGLGLMFSLSCTKYPTSSERLTEDLAVITLFDTKANFNLYKTYSISSPVMKVTDEGTVPMTGQTADAVLTQIDKNMKNRGFVPVVAPQKPDLGIQVMYYQNTTVYAYYYSWWGYYPYYPYYYPVYYSSYTTGMANIELMDLKNATTDNRTAVRWNAFIRGLLTGSHTTAEITASVDQAFTQTPQLITTR